jgi:hypothetical protein
LIRNFFCLNVMKLLHIFHLFLSLLISAQFSSAQEIFQPSARSLAMAGVSSTLSGGWSVFGNQAGLASVQHPEVAGSFQSRFLLAELSARTGLFVIPVQTSVFAFSFYQFGQIPFRQEKYGFAYSRQVFPKLNFGIQFNYYSLYFSEENRSASSAGLELGLQYLFSDKLIIGAHVLNPYQTGIKIYSGKHSYPSAFNLGILYKLSESFGLASELQNDFDRHFRLKTGMEYSFPEKLFLRAGISGKPYQFSAGIGFRIQKISFDIASSYHQYLGNSPAVSFQYQF